MLKIFDTLPFRAIRGAGMGLEDGMRGEVDTNYKFSDGYRENDPKKKSAAGQFLSDYSGIRGGARVGEKVGQIGGGAACGLFAANFLSNVLAVGVAAGTLGGLFPVVMAGVLVVGAAVFGGALLGVAGKYAGGVVGAAIGGVGGTAVGLYNGVFRRGYYAKGKSPEKAEPAVIPETPQPEGPTPAGTPLEPGQNLAEPQSFMGQQAEPPQGTVIAKNHPRVEAVLNNTAPPAAKEDQVLAANTRMPESVIGKIGRMAAIGGGSALAAIGVKSAVHAVHERKAAQQNGGQAPVQPQPAQNVNMAQALQQVDSSMLHGAVQKNMQASPEEIAAAQAAAPRTFAERARPQPASQPSRDEGQAR